jgi:hypothetical protein
MKMYNTLAGDDSLGHHLMKNFAPLAISCELDYISVADTPVAACSWVRCLRCVQLHTDGPSKRVLFLQQKPPWSYLAQTISTAVSESLHLIRSSAILLG